MPLFLLQNSISSRQVHVIATYVLKAFFSASKANLIFILKKSYTAQRKLHKFLNIWGKRNYYKFHLASSFSFHSRLL